MQVGDSDVAGIANLQRQRETTFATLFFRLQRIDLPVGCILQHHFGADVMLAGEFVNAPAGRCVGDVQASLRKRAGSPDVKESSAAAVGDPEAGILAVPAALDVGVRSVVVIVDLLPDFAAFVERGVRIDGAVTAKEAHVVEQGIFAGHPLCGNGARIDAVGVETDSGDDVCAALGRFEQRLGSADTLERRSSVGKQDARDAGMQADEDRVWLELNGVGDAILAGWEIDGFVLGNGSLQGGGVVSGAITRCAERADVHPSIHRGQIADVGVDGRRKSGQRRGVKNVLHDRNGANVGEMKTVRESFDRVHFVRAGDLLAAFAEERKNRNAAANHILHVDFCARTVFVADDHRGAGDIFETRILDPEFLGIVGVDGNGRGNIFELRSNQGETRLVLADCRFALPLESAVDYRKLPSGRRLAGPDAILPSEEMQIVRDVAAVVNSGEG